MLNSRSPWFPLRDENNEIYWFNYETHERMTSIPHNHRKWIENLNKPIVGLSKEQIEYKYIEMFLEKNVSSFSEWEETLVKIIQHPSYKLLKTLEERKYFFHKKYIPIRKEIEKELAFIEEGRSLIGLRKFCLQSPLLIDKCPLPSREKEYAKIVENELIKTFPLISHIDNRIIIINSLRERWELVEEDRRKKRQQIYPILLKELEQLYNKDNHHLSYTKFKGEIFPNILKNNSQDLAFHFFFNKDSSINWMEVLDFWKYYIKDYILKEDEIRERKEKLERNRLSRFNRKEFFNLLREVKPSNWKNFFETSKEDPRFLNMIGQCTGSNSLSLYWDYIDSCSIDSDNSIKDGKDINMNNNTNLTNNMISKSSYKELNKENISALKDLLKNGPFTIDHSNTSFEEYSTSPLIMDNPKWTNIKDDSIKRKYFGKYISYLLEKSTFPKEEGEI